jgi:hypothetical protein
MITIKEINDKILEVFGEDETLDVSTVYEEYSKGYKLVIFFHKLYTENNFILYTKLIFNVDKEKTKLKEDSFYYLYDINCKYRKVLIDDIFSFEDKINLIIDKDEFGKDLKLLSKFMEYPSTMLNDWFYENKIDNINIEEFSYEPKQKISPCEDLVFDFKGKVNDIDFDLKLNKIEDELYRYDISSSNKNESIEKISLDDMVETIARLIKNNIA